MTGPRPMAPGSDSAEPTFAECLAAGLRELEREACGSVLVPGALSTGLAPLDAALGGLRPGAVYVVAGRPGMGATALAIGLTLAVARDSPGAATKGTSQRRAWYFTLALSAPALATRMLAAEAGVDVDLLRGEAPDRAAWSRLVATAEALSGRSVRVIGDSTPTIAGVAASLADCRRDAPGAPALVVLDPVDSLIDGEESPGEVARMLQRVAVEGGAAVVLTAPVKSALERRQDRRPRLGDLLLPDDLLGAADVVLLLYRPAYYGVVDALDADRAEVLVARNRFGRTRNVGLRFDRRCARFEPA